MNDVQEKPPTTSDKLPSTPIIYIYQTPLVHDSPASITQSSIEDLVPQTCSNQVFQWVSISGMKEAGSSPPHVPLIYEIHWLKAISIEYTYNTH